MALCRASGWHAVEAKRDGARGVHRNLHRPLRQLVWVGRHQLLCDLAVIHLHLRFKRIDQGHGDRCTPELIGIDPPPLTANAVPYSPLLTMIDNFAAGNSYATSGISGWGWANLDTLSATSGQIVTDFSEFFGIQPTGGPSYTPSVSSAFASVSISTGSGSDTSTSVSGFPSVGIVSGEICERHRQFAGFDLGRRRRRRWIGRHVLPVQHRFRNDMDHLLFLGETLIPASSYNLPAQNITFSVPGTHRI